MEFILNLQFIFKPLWWIMNESYFKKWDNQLKYLLDNYDFTDIKHHTAKLNGIEIWTSNHPYSSFMPYGAGKSNFRASRLTIKRAQRKLTEDALSMCLKDVID